MKILLITSEGFDTPNPNNQMAERMILDFLKNGYEIHLIQSRRKRMNPDIPGSLEGAPGFSLNTIDRKSVDKTNFIRRYIDDSLYAISSMKVWRRIKSADIVLLQSNPTSIFSMLLLKVFYRKPIIFNIYDVFPGHAYDIGVITSKLTYKCLQWIQRLVYRMADVITVLSEDMKRKVMEQGAFAEKIHVIPAWYDENFVKEIPVSDNRFIQKYCIPTDKFYIQYAGTVGYVFNYATVIELAKRLLPAPNFVIQIIGDGNLKEPFIKRATKLGLKNISFYPLQPVEMVPDVYSAGNICIIPLQKGVIGNGVPSKAPVVMACGRVIVNSVESNSEYSRMFNDNGIGYSVDIDDIDSLTERIKYCYKNPEEIERMADRAKSFSAANFTSAINTRKFMNIFDELSQRNQYAFETSRRCEDIAYENNADQQPYQPRRSR